MKKQRWKWTKVKNVTITCYGCSGTGVDNGGYAVKGVYPNIETYYREPDVCQYCKGTGKLKEPHPRFFLEPFEHKREMVKVNACCGCYVGEPKWQQGLEDWHLEPDECMWEDVIELDKEDWEDGFASMKCPKCGAELTQDMDHFQLISEGLEVINL